MIVISEWLPNPHGTDTDGEWIEIRNIGNLSQDVTGWSLTADGKKFFKLDGTLAPGAYAVLPRDLTKITLRNTDGRLAIYDGSGRLADQAYFLASAPEGLSVNRSSNGSYFFSDPTPARANAVSAPTNLLQVTEYRPGDTVRTKASNIFEFSGYLIGTALALSIALVVILRSYEDLSCVFFKGDSDARSGYS